MLDQFRAQKIEWNRANNQIYDRVETSSGDSNGRTLFVQISNGGTVEDLTGATLSLAWNKKTEQGLESFEEVDAKKGQFRLFYPTGMLVNRGVLQASLVLVDVTGRIESKPFDIIVHKGTVDDEAVESDNKFTALTTALVKVSQVQAEFDSLYADKSQMMDTLHDDKKADMEALEQDYANRANTLETTYVPRLTGVEGEIDVARGGAQTLGERLDSEKNEITAQLAHKAEQTDLLVEKARIDSFTTLAVGSTTGDAELIDARIGADGITYPNAGSANRTQFGKIKNDLDNTTTRSTNLMPIGTTILDWGGVTSVYSDGIMTLSGVSTSQGGRTNKRVSPFTLASGTYTIRAYSPVAVDTLWLHKTSDNSAIASGFNVEAMTFTLTESTEMYIGFNVLQLDHVYTATIKIQLEKGTTANEFQPPSYITSNDLVARKYIATLIDDDNESYTSTYSSNKIKKMTSSGGLPNPLLGLKLVVAGDSITAGENTNYEYGSLARDYYGLNYLNTAMGGRTMADVKVNGVSRNGFAVDRYTLVPNDTDILTIMFGYNDQAYGWVSKRDDYCISTYGVLYQGLTAEQKTAVDAYKTHAQWTTDFIGVITDTDTSTWCGAWNFVLDYFAIQKSIERIGVILPYGVDNAYIEPLKTICGRYGVAYIDSANPNEIPSVGYSNPPFAQSGHYRDLYTYDGLHPNEAGYERMARGYIPWIAKI